MLQLGCAHQQQSTETGCAAWHFLHRGDHADDTLQVVRIPGSTPGWVSCLHWQRFVMLPVAAKDDTQQLTCDVLDYAVVAAARRTPYYA